MPAPALIDCDPGIDDALALLVAAASPEFELLGVTTVAGNRDVDTTTGNACRLLHAAGRETVPVHKGCSLPLTGGPARTNTVHGLDGLGGVSLPVAGQPAAGTAVECLVDVLGCRPQRTVDVIALGPLTNLAQAELAHPGLLRRARRLLIMGGAAFRRGNVTAHAEFNFHADPVAADLVLRSGADIVLFGLDVTQQAVVAPGWVASLPGQGRGCADACHAMLERYASTEPLLHDTCPVAYALQPELFELQAATARVITQQGDQQGRLLATRVGDMDGAARLRLAMKVDAGALLALVRERLFRLP